MNLLHRSFLRSARFSEILGDISDRNYCEDIVILAIEAVAKILLKYWYLSHRNYC